jgi:hypothetical protein
VSRIDRLGDYRYFVTRLALKHVGMFSVPSL